MGEPYLVELSGEETDLKRFSYLGRILLSTKSCTESLSLLTRLNTCTVYVNAVSLQTEECIKLLDNGASKLFVKLSQFNDIVGLRDKNGNRLLQDHERLVISTDGRDGGDMFGIKGRDICLSHGVKNADSKNKTYVALAENSIKSLKSSLRKGHIPIIPATYLTAKPSGISPETLITSYLQTDRPDGLYTTVVVDERNICLGVVYSSEASIRASIEDGRGVYQSRKRGLWYKGDSTGDTQELVRIGLDCDGDALMFTVRQKGDGELVCAIGEITLILSKVSAI